MSNHHEAHDDIARDDHDHDDHEHGDHEHADHEHGDHEHADPDDHESGEPLADLPATPEHGYWKSLRELSGEASFQVGRTGHEFPPEAEVAPKDPLSRRNFFHLMGASMALAGVAGCRRYEKEEIVPLARRPEDQTPGVTQQYATAFELGGVGHAMLATSFEGRPIKLDGNPEHPFASGGIVTGTERRAGATTFAQASILHLYDPDRSQTATSEHGTPSSMEAFRAALTQLRASLGTTHVLSEATSSPTARALRAKLIGQGVRWHEYEPLSWDNERAGTRMAFGDRSLRPIAKLDRAETIVTIDCDIFTEHPAVLKYSRDFARSRRQNGTLGIGKMNRLWSVESTFSNTGAMADHRLALRSELGLPFAMALDAALGGGAPPNAELLKEPKVDKYLKVLVEELKKNDGKSVVIAGRRQPPEVHALVARINQAIHAPGQTLEYVEDPDGDRPTHLKAITELTKAMAAPGGIGTLIIIGGNPVYDAPADLDFAAALKSVRTSIHLHEYHNETSQLATWHVPRAHFLEAWGDIRTWDGTITLAQPLVAPLYGGLSAIELMSLLLGEEKGGQELVEAAHRELGFEANWKQHVHDGFVPNTEHAVVQATPATFQLPALSPSQQSGSLRTNGELEVTFQQSSFTYDGRYGNNAWMWETPDFMTKVTWDNYALVGANTASGLGLENDTLIKVKVGDKEIELPCYTMPGQAKGSIALVLGGGRTAAGRVGGHGKRTVGWDTYKVRTTTGWDYATKATVTPTGKSYTLANIQEHWDIRTGLGNVGQIKREGSKINAGGLEERIPELIREVKQRDLVSEASWRAEEPEGGFNDLANRGNTDREGEGGLSLFKEKDYQGHRWAMAIDLSTCTGCNACMVACQAENNVPVVGRNEVMNNREMSWIRIDRYFKGTVEDPQVVYQPIACMQCEQAPCEQVCPVGATTHSDEGLNDMAFNRCIGTRYCANNCPYKVRRFNFLDWNKEWRDARNRVRRLLFNPEVTVRMRGVMEKCTYCVQRIQNAKIKAKAQIRAGQRPGSVNGVLPDGEIETACQQACPTEAIVFGDLADKASRVYRLHQDRASYALLPETYTKPRTRFLARVRNPNPSLDTAAPQGGHE
ncbi:MAG TPA: TAT-variant-translocated molybdopterin oxidoreductase [Kofleriaceae bacterium]|nr:TAT-variant-translocated molybdopterin oxidoreductase [Kofleriaceae bacterium]